MTGPYWHGNVWVCHDCFFAHHYGATEHDGKWYAGESDEPCHREPLSKLDGCHIADNTYPDGDDSDETGEREFSWSTCDGCGSNLGGSRYRLVWREVDHDPR